MALTVAAPQSATAVSATWTFEHILLLLQHEEQGPRDDKLLNGCLISFLTANKDIYTDGGLPFKAAKVEHKDLPKSFTLRTVKYENTLSEENTKYVNEISDILQLDQIEVLRIVLCASQKIPKQGLTDICTDTARLGLANSGKTETLLYYLSQVLREQRSIIRTCFLLLKNDNIATACSVSEEVSHGLMKNGYALVEKQIQNIDDIVSQLENKQADDQVGKLILHEYFLTLLDLLGYITYLVTTSETAVVASVVVKWFDIMHKSSYLSHFKSLDIISNEQQMTVEALCTVISLSLLDMDRNFGSLEDDWSYMNQPQCMLDINKALSESASNPIVLYAWSIILHRKYTVLDLESNKGTDGKAASFIDKFMPLATIRNLFVSFANNAARLGVTDALQNCHKLLQYDPIYSDILGSFVIAFAPYVRMADKTITEISNILSSASDDTVKRFFENPAAEDMMTLARAKLPLSLKSFVSLVGINANLATEEMKTFSSYMQIMPEKPFGYKYSIDDVNPDLIKLVEDVDVAPPFESGKELSLLLKQGTRAQIFPTGQLKVIKGEKASLLDASSNEDNAVLVAFLYTYSGWAVLGRILHNLAIHLEDDEARISFLQRVFWLLTRVFRQSDSRTIADIISALNSFIGQHDFIDVTFRIFEQGLNIRSVPLLSACVDFLTALCVKGYSYRVWSYLYRSNIFGIRPGGCKIAMVTGTREVVSGDFALTLSLLKLGSALVRDCIRIEENVSLKLKSQVIEALIVYFVQLFANFSSWKYTDIHQRPQIGSQCVRLFDAILTSLYGVDEYSKPENKVNSFFYASSKRILDAFLLPASQESRCVKPIVSLIESISSTFTDCVSSDMYGFWNYRWLHDAFSFASTLIKVRSTTLPDTVSSLEMELFSRLPNLVTLYLTNLDKRQLVSQLLISMASAKWHTEPPSFLTHLSHVHTEILLRCLCVDTGNRAELYTLRVTLYDLFSAVIKGGQEGLSIVLITGRDIKDSMRDDTEKLSASKRMSLLEVIKKDVGSIRIFPPHVALHMTDAISLAFSSWTSAEQQADDTEFVKQLLSKLDDFPSGGVKEDAPKSAYVDYCYEVRLISKVAEILSLYLFVSYDRADRQIILKKLNDPSFIKSLSSKFAVLGYDSSLQRAVESDFHRLWPSYKLSQFAIASGYKEHHYGSRSVFSFNLLELLLGESDNWSQISEQIESASINLQYAMAQVSVVKAYGALITCLCKVGKSEMDSGYLKLGAELMKQCDGSEITDIFGTVFQTRVELTFYICMCFSQNPDFKPDKQFLFEIISFCSKLLVSREVDLSGSLLSMEVNCYKPLLRILLIALSMVKAQLSDMTIQYSATFIDVFSVIICRSINVLFQNIKAKALSKPNTEIGHSPLVLKQTGDITLILSLLKVFMELDLHESVEKAVAKFVVTTGCFRTLCSVYGVSHMIKFHDNEVFADYSLMFLFEFVSHKKLIARELIRNGLFDVLIDSPISNRIQAGNAKAYPIANSGLQHLWSDGLLPIALVALSFFGDSILPQICLFATAFNKQIASTIQEWFNADSFICTKLIQETSQIVLLAKALSSLDAYNYIRNSVSEQFDQTAVVLVPGLDTETERKKLVIALKYLISHPKYLSLRIVPSNEDEQRILQSDDSSKLVEGVLAKLKELKSVLE
ncbi:hypothetical protein BRETT_001731 [Brettanomyces bruxellensis]|uniref:Nucleoporin NUP188 n=1 Tax=Dekkera bruxellensis TaxID=5007 RepID=A0A871R203_DEKBR|nr:uncharacterized protein BRETT_001731 [Brettanomyces bruxellensis]QOU18664.1 hypothetical protein BRETT_001731 [Brettanomyces bruxellensis]